MKKSSHVVLDTNVLLVANEEHEDVSPDCAIACITELESIRNGRCLVIDDRYEILEEYQRKTAPNTGNRVGDAFLKWVYQNVANTKHVDCVHIEPHEHRGYVAFPDDVKLLEFDHADRKFIAVARVHAKSPPILQGTDSKWTEWSPKLLIHGITVEFLCPKDVERFIRRKRA